MLQKASACLSSVPMLFTGAKQIFLHSETSLAPTAVIVDDLVSKTAVSKEQNCVESELTSFEGNSMAHLLE